MTWLYGGERHFVFVNIIHVEFSFKPERILHHPLTAFVSPPWLDLGCSFLKYKCIILQAAAVLCHMPSRHTGAFTQLSKKGCGSTVAWQSLNRPAGAESTPQKCSNLNSASKVELHSGQLAPDRKTSLII